MPHRDELRGPSALQWPELLWHVGIVGLIVFGPGALGLLDAPFPPSAVRQLQLFVWSVAYLAAALALTLWQHAGAKPPAVAYVAVPVVTWGIGSAYLYLHTDAARSTHLGLAVLAISMVALGALPYLRQRLQRASVASGVIAVIAVAAMLVAVAPMTRRLPVQEHPDHLPSQRYDLAITAIADLRGRVDSRGGGLAALSDGYLLVTGEGRVMRLTQLPSDSFRIAEVEGAVPMPRAGFDSAARTVRMNKLFRVTSVLIDTTSRPARLYVAHHRWDPIDSCLSLIVSESPIALADAQPRLRWSTLYQTHPCLPLRDKMDAYESGGRLAWAGDGGLLLSVGDHGFNGLDMPAYAQDASVDYGKVLHLSRSGQRLLLSLGHRNMQGLVTGRDGIVWSVEHGPQGGDELNVIQPGGNYGWPFRTYGTDYGAETWPPATRTPAGFLFVEPAIAFVPSIAPSSLLEVHHDRFAMWQGDLLIATLGRGSLLRVHRDGDRVRYVESMSLGVRTRDLVEGTDGALVLWTELGVLLRITESMLTRPEPTGRRTYGTSRPH